MAATGDRLVANKKSDCKVCPSGRYQHVPGSVDCVNCPEGSVRYRNLNDDAMHWNGDYSGVTFSATVWTISNAAQTGKFVKIDAHNNKIKE